MASTDHGGLSLPRLRCKLWIKRRLSNMIHIVAQRLERYNRQHVQDYPLSVANPLPYVIVKCLNAPYFPDGLRLNPLIIGSPSTRRPHHGSGR